MKMKFKILSIALAAFFFSGCLTIIEEYTFEKDGSGTAVIGIDMGDLLDVFSAFMPEEEGQDFKSYQHELDSIVQAGSGMDQLDFDPNEIKGISNFGMIKDTSSLVFGFSFHFDDTKALERFYTANEGDQKISISKKKFSKQSLGSEHLEKFLGSEEQMEIEGLDLEFTYKQVFHFPREVKKVLSLHEQITMEDGNKTVIIESNLQDVLKETFATKVEILFK